MTLKHLSLLGLLGFAVLLVAACGSDDNGDSTKAATSPPATQPPATQKTQPPATNKATVKLTEYAFTPKDVVVKAGKVTISAPNDGKVVHELVLLKTSADPANLPKKGSEVDESTSVGEIADVEPGATKKVTLKLTPGKYAMVCALPGHYGGHPCSPPGMLVRAKLASRGVPPTAPRSPAACRTRPRRRRPAAGPPSARR